MPFDFGLKFILRLVAPGTLLAGIALPATRALAAIIYPGLGDAPLYVASGLIFGFMLLLLDMPVYMLLEGRRFWPQWLREKGIAWQARRLRRLTDEAVKLGSDQAKELHILAYQYPISRATGEPHADHPTRLGNLLASFETYPTVKYGLDGVFYWPRLWVTLDKDLREELDSAQAVVDGAIYCTFAFMVSTIACLAYWHFLPSDAWWHWPAAAAACAALAFSSYRLALPRYAQYGDLFAATFDQFRDKLAKPDFLPELDTHMQAPAPIRSERDKARSAWRFLRWHEYRPDGTPTNTVVRNW